MKRLEKQLEAVIKELKRRWQALSKKQQEKVQLACLLIAALLAIAMLLLAFRQEKTAPEEPVIFPAPIAADQPP